MVSYNPHDTPLGHFLADHWANAGLTLRDFAKRIRRSPAYVSLIRTGKRQPPADHYVHMWADALGIEGSDREYLLDLAALERTPERIRLKYQRLAHLAATAATCGVNL